MALAVPPGGLQPPTEPTVAPGRAITAPAAVGTPSRPEQPFRPLRKSAPPNQLSLSVVVVNFCQWRNTARLVTQLRRSIAVRTGVAKIVVVDNNSPFHPVINRLRRLSGVAVHRFRRNHGFARAVNRGSRMTDSRWVLLLNPDVTVPDGFLDEVLAEVEGGTNTPPGIGVMGFRLLNADGSGQASSGPFPTLGNTVSGLLRPRSRRKCRHRADPDRGPVGWVTGGCLLVRRECFEQLGGLDESFFLYYEDVDFCQRAATAGWSVWYDPRLEVTHHWPLHARSVPAPLRLMTRHALLTYTRKHWPRWQAGALAGLMWAEAGLRQLWSAVRGDRTAARSYAELRRLIADVHGGRDDQARKRIRHTATLLDSVAAEQDGRT
jgi:GT2 family glycosyltransferase